MAMTFFARFASSCEIVPFARAEISHHDGRHQREKQMRHALPSPPRTIRAAKFPRELVEVFARRILPLFQRQLQRRLIVRGLRQLLRAGRDDRRELLVRRIVGQRVVNVLPRPPVPHQPGLAELPEVHGNARLPEPEDLLKLDDAQLLALQKQEQPQPRFVGDQAQGFDDRGQEMSAVRSDGVKSVTSAKLRMLLESRYEDEFLLPMEKP